MDEHTIDVGGTPVFYRRATGGALLYLHSVPTSSDDWRDMLARTGGVAPDLPGFGRSGKAAHYDYSLAGYARSQEFTWAASAEAHLACYRRAVEASADQQSAV